MINEISPFAIDAVGGLNAAASERLLRAVLSGELVPGQAVSENELIKQFGLTRAPVRRAIAEMTMEGWFCWQSKKRCIVKPITLRDVREVFDLRRMLEPEAARRAAGRVSREQLEALDAMLQRDYDTEDVEAEGQFFAANAALHVGICKAAGNERLTATVAKLHAESERILRVGMRYARWSAGWRHGHEELIDALASGKGELAAEIALRQLEYSERVVLDAITDLFDDMHLSLQPQNGRGA